MNCALEIIVWLEDDTICEVFVQSVDVLGFLHLSFNSSRSADKQHDAASLTFDRSRPHIEHIYL